MIRAFIAIDIPPSAKDALRMLQDELQSVKAQVKWVDPGNIHITLKFLGNVDPEKIPQIREVLTPIAASTRPFMLIPRSCGAFPSIKKIRVIWAGIDGALEPLRKLQGRIEDSLIELGFEPEARDFRAHLTIGRVKGRKNLQALQQAILDHQQFQAEAFDVKDIVPVSYTHLTLPTIYSV